MSKPTLFSQERMDDSFVPTAKKKGFDSFKEFFESPEISNQKKLDQVGQFSQFVTLNGLTKADLHAALKWLFDQGYEFVDVDQPPKLRLIRGEKDDWRSVEDEKPIAGMVVHATDGYIVRDAFWIPPAGWKLNTGFGWTDIFGNHVTH